MDATALMIAWRASQSCGCYNCSVSLSCRPTTCPTTCTGVPRLNRIPNATPARSYHDYRMLECYTASQSARAVRRVLSTNADVVRKHPHRLFQELVRVLAQTRLLPSVLTILQCPMFPARSVRLMWPSRCPHLHIDLIDWFAPSYCSYYNRQSIPTCVMW